MNEIEEKLQLSFAFSSIYYNLSAGVLEIPYRTLFLFFFFLAYWLNRWYIAQHALTLLGIQMESFIKSLFFSSNCFLNIFFVRFFILFLFCYYLEFWVRRRRNFYLLRDILTTIPAPCFFLYFDFFFYWNFIKQIRTRIIGFEFGKIRKSWDTRIKA